MWFLKSLKNDETSTALNELYIRHIQMPSHTIAKVILTQTCVKFIFCHAIPGQNRYPLRSVRLKDYFL